MDDLDQHNYLIGQSQKAFEPSVVPYVNAIYYPNWRVYRQQFPSSLNLGFVSHVFYAFALPTEGGSIVFSDEYIDTQIECDGARGCVEALMSQKRQHPHLKIILSIGGGGDGSAYFSSIGADDSKRSVFAQSVKDMVDRFGFDGIDIDWEYPSNPLQGLIYVSLLAALRSLLPSPVYILTSALNGGDWALRNIPLREAATHLDFLNLMAYDFSGPWTRRASHQAPLYTSPDLPNETALPSCLSAILHVLGAGVPGHKIVLGIPAYGRSFLGAARPGDSYNGNGGQEGIFEYRDLPRPGTQELVNTTLGAAFCVGGDGGFVSYDSPQTVRMKAAFVKNPARRLRGLFYWSGASDVSHGNRSLIENGYYELHGL